MNKFIFMATAALLLALSACGDKASSRESTQFDSAPSASLAPLVEFKSKHYSIQLPSDWAQEMDMMGMVMYGNDWNDCFGKASFAMINPNADEGQQAEIAAMTIQQHLADMVPDPTSPTKASRSEVIQMNGMDVALVESTDPAQDDIPAMKQRSYVFKKGDLSATFNFIALESCWDEYVKRFEPSVKTIQLF